VGGSTSFQSWRDRLEREEQSSRVRSNFSNHRPRPFFSYGNRSTACSIQISSLLTLWGTPRQAEQNDYGGWRKGKNREARFE